MIKEHVKNVCNHEWATRYSRFGACEGVEWYCTKRCDTNLTWPEVIRRVNEHELPLTQAVLLVAQKLDEIGNLIEDYSK